jgi:hypothetical protein
MTSSRLALQASGWTLESSAAARCNRARSAPLLATAPRSGLKEISRHMSSDMLAGYVREAELFQQHASVGMY